MDAFSDPYAPNFWTGFSHICSEDGASVFVVDTAKDAVAVLRNALKCPANSLICS